MNYLTTKISQIITPETQLSGIRDCHVQGLHSIVLRTSDHGFLSRVYLAEAHHELYHNEHPNPKMTLGIHGHRTGIRLTGLAGQMMNMTYQTTPTNFQKYEVERCAFDSKIKGGSGALLRGPMTDLYATGTINHLRPWSRTWLDASELHTVHVARYQRAAWLIEEYEADRPHDTSCYTLNPAYNPEGMYTPMDHYECLRLLGSFGYAPESPEV